MSPTLNVLGLSTEETTYALLKPTLSTPVVLLALLILLTSTGCPTSKLCGCFVVIIPTLLAHEAVIILLSVLRSVSEVRDASLSWNLLSSITDALS